MIRLGAVILATIAAVLTPGASSAPAATDTWCGPGLGGTWEPQSGRCTLSLVSPANAAVNISVSVPVELLDDPTAGPVLSNYALRLGSTWRAAGQTLLRDNTSTSEPTVFSHTAAVKSVVFHERFQTLGTNANDAYRTFTFDLQRGKVLTLSDLFRPDVDPLTAIPPAARPYLDDALADAQPAHLPDVYPFIADRWEPQPDGSGFSGDYRAFALTPDELIFYMPDRPMTHENPPPRGQLQWSMDGGTVQLHIPLSALASSLAPAYAMK